MRPGVVACSVMICGVRAVGIQAYCLVTPFAFVLIGCIEYGEK